MSEQREGFCITNQTGFHITFPNGYTISVQFGPANYCDNYNRGIGRDEQVSGEEGSATAETAYWGPDGKLISERQGEYTDTVQGYQTVAQVFERMQRIAALPRPVAVEA